MTSSAPEFFAPTGTRPPHVIDLAGVRADCLRVICDREHPVYPSHGECNGPPLNVPFGILDRVAARGAPQGEVSPPPYLPRLRSEKFRARGAARHERAPRAGLVLFEGPQFAVGFSLDRPMLRHLAWDALGAAPRRAIDLWTGGVTAIRSAFRGRTSARRRWTAGARVDGIDFNRWRARLVSRSRLRSRRENRRDVRRVERRHATRSDDARRPRLLPVIEFEAWRLVFNLATP
jgi:hypothetical protein